MAKTEKVGKKNETTIQQNENIVTRTIEFFNRYQTIIYGILIALLVVIIGIVAINRFYLQPKTERGSMAMLVPMDYYRQGVQSADSLMLTNALEGDEENDGFLSIISSYKMTKTGNSANYFAGLCYLHLKDTESALHHFLKFKKREDVYWYSCQMLIGDLYDQMEEGAKAITYYKKSVKGDDPFTTPVALFKLGQLYEKEENWKEALASYQKIENSYAEHYTMMGVEKYLERAKLKVAH